MKHIIKATTFHEDAALAIDEASFLDRPITVKHRRRQRECKHRNKLGKGLHKREPVEGGRPAVVATRLTREQAERLDWLVSAYTKKHGVAYSRAAVLAKLLDRASWTTD